jgi:hypothetical protein
VRAVGGRGQGAMGPSPGSKIKDHGAKVKDHGSLALGPCPLARVSLTRGAGAQGVGVRAGNG